MLFTLVKTLPIEVVEDIVFGGRIPVVEV